MSVQAKFFFFPPIFQTNFGLYFSRRKNRVRGERELSILLIVEFFTGGFIRGKV